MVLERVLVELLRGLVLVDVELVGYVSRNVRRIVRYVNWVVSVGD